MMEIFNFFGSILGYVLWAAWYLVKNFGIAIILFTIFIKLVVFPFTIKQQKSMANNARIQKKQQELREKYGNNKEKLNEEMQKLYEREGVSMSGGCLTSIIPMLIMLGLFYSVASPLTNTLHLDAAKVSEAMSYINTIPGLEATAQGIYGQIELVRIFPNIADTGFITNLFSPAEISNIVSFSGSFNFLGMDLLTTPSSLGIFSWYFLIPVLCFVSAIGSQFIMMKLNGTMNQQQGCMTIMMIVFPLFSAYIAYTVPSAVGFYWILSYVISLLQSVILSKFFNPVSMIAKSEAQHVALLEMNEANVPRIYAPASVNKGINKNKSKKKK